MDEKLRRAFESVISTEFPEFIQTLEQNLDFERWGFRRIFTGIGKYSPIVVYESEVCRVMFGWMLPDIRDGIVMIPVQYGRLHAPIDEDVIVWKGQKCYCWHDIDKALYFLDGLPASEAVKNKYGLPDVMMQFRKSSVRKHWSQIEYTIKMHATIWNHYGPRLFALFDLRKPSVWEQYSRYVSEYQELNPEFSLSGRPAPDEVC